MHNNNLMADDMLLLILLQGGWGKPGTLLMCGLTNWEMAGRKAPPKSLKTNVGRSLWTPHTFKNLNGARVRLIASGPAASHNIIVTEDNRCLTFGKNDKGKSLVIFLFKIFYERF